MQWLTAIKDFRAAAWFEPYWTGEFGNFTNATAGYVGLNKASGMEGDWRYLWRDTIGTSGTNKRMSMKNVAPRLLQYMADYSKRHAVKILCPITGIHKFPFVPEIGVQVSLSGKLQKCAFAPPTAQYC